jgi:RNA polymerase sigma-70 factor (ECF subfamily)
VNKLAAALAIDLDAAFPKLVASMQDRMYSLSLSLTGSPHDAQDVAQDSFVRAYAALRKYPPARIRALQVRPWLAKIALNVWRNRVRGRWRDSIPLEVEIEADPREAPPERAQMSESAAEIRDLLGRMPQRYRLAVVLRHAYDVPYGEAAAALGIPVGTLKANVHRGTRMLREAFKSRTKVDNR